MTGRMLVEKIAAEHPALFLRIRLACESADPWINRDEHAALVCQMVLNARKRAAA